ncbi:MAG: sodium:calcium antiporter [Pseudanabaenaceae cyanobacterium SKYGB_i_bin29]|nr:sodium:calcium antiporter [Pseudanabaenaceae cyanobacterium SKYG29]MDW8421432.1 sodium:calcium antiporter [Pseudanabaenaceae cyanobacterium SKYGB_i_bin29]
MSFDWLWSLLIIPGVGLIVWGAETFAQHIGKAALGLGVSGFALALLLAGAEPEELATAITAAVKGAPAIALGDAIGANIAICLVALGVGAVWSPLPFSRKVWLYGLLALPISTIGVFFIWDGVVTRLEGFLLVLSYILYVGLIWWQEKEPPALGEVEEFLEEEEAEEKIEITKEMIYVFGGLAGMTIGSVLLVEAVRRIAPIESTQALISLSLVGFATAFELVVLCWSAARQGATDVVIAGVVGSFAYNTTMTVGLASLLRPLQIEEGSLLHRPGVVMLACLVLVLVLAARKKKIDRFGGFILLASYPLFIASLFLPGL